MKTARARGEERGGVGRKTGGQKEEEKAGGRREGNTHIGPNIQCPIQPQGGFSRHLSAIAEPCFSEQR